MKRMIALVVAAGVLLALSLSISAAVPNARSNQPSWEYRVVSTFKPIKYERITDLERGIKRRARLLEDQLNELGEGGWQLAGSSEGLLVFKRQR